MKKTYVLYAQNEFCFVDLSAAPGPPQDLKTARVGPDYVTLEWKPPAKDGGAKITGYRVEKCEETSEEWVKVEDIKAFDTVYKVTSLKEGMGYYFSVSAKNQVGYGEPCETDKAIKPKKPEGRHDIFPVEGRVFSFLDAKNQSVMDSELYYNLISVACASYC